MQPYADAKHKPPFAHTRELMAGFQPGTEPLPIEVVIDSKEATTRTAGTFLAAARAFRWDRRLVPSSQDTSIVKGEGPGHDIDMVACTQLGDIYCVRATPEGYAKYASEVVAGHHKILGFESPWQVPVINMGDGCHGHPTQALGDLYFFLKCFGALDNFILGIVGGLDLSRTAAELLRAARICGFKKVKLFCDDTSLPPASWLEGVNWEHCPSWDGIQECDVLNWIRPQDERSHDALSFMRLMAKLKFTSRVAALCKDDVVQSHAQPIKDRNDLLPVFPRMYTNPGLAKIQLQAHGMVAVRMAVLHTVWQNRNEETIIPTPPIIRLGPIEKMSTVEKNKELAVKKRKRRKAGKTESWTPIVYGTIIEPLEYIDALMLHQWMMHKGIISDKVPGLKAALGPFDTSKIEGGLKGVIVLEGVILDKQVMAAIQQPFPTARFNVVRKSLFKKYVFLPEKLTSGSVRPLTPDGVLPCPNPNCVTNQCAQAETGLWIDKKTGRLTCRFCERDFNGQEVHDAIGRIVGFLETEGI